MVLKKGQIAWKHALYCRHFYVNLKFLGLPYGKYIKTMKMAACSEDFHCKDNFDVILVIFCSNCYGTNSSEIV